MPDFKPAESAEFQLGADTHADRSLRRMRLTGRLHQILPI